MKSRICDILQIRYPVFQGAMAWISDSNLAAAVSEAGGLGIIAAGNAPKDWIVKEIRNCRKITEKPFAVNIMLLSPFVDDIVDAVIKENVDIIVTGAGNPGRHFRKLNDAGIRIIPVVSSVSQAKRMARNEGVIAVIAEGCEAGGHIGNIGTMSLVPQIADAIDIPVIAAGGIADGRGMAAAICLGADAIQLGTRFIVADECRVRDEYKQKIINGKDTSTVITGTRTGHPVRVIRNRFTKEFIDLEKRNVSAEQLEIFGTGRLKMAAIDGDCENGSVMSGQSAGLVNKKESCKSIIEDIVKGCEKIMRRNSYE